ncbi:hypothetical protein BDR03DRAFT_1011444 [Suillus americanus]|nr:hypothetical protein BDR03DRAFT_1011444 [Suillus americanus]
MPPKKPLKGKRKSKQIPKFPESTGKNPCGNTASAQIGLAIEHPVVPSRLAIQPAATHPPQPRLHSAQLMAPYVRSLQQGLPHMYNMMMNPLSRDMMGGASTMSHPQFMEWQPPQMDLPSRDFMMAQQIPPSNQQSMAGTSAIPPAQFEQRMPSQSATPFQYQSRIQAPALNVEGIHQAVDNYRPGLKM